MFFSTCLSADTAKANRAEALIAKGGVISVQVLNELASVALRKLGMSWSEIREVLQTLRRICRVVPTTDDAYDHALGLCERYGFSVYDSMILASALEAGCAVVLTEDLQDGQRIEGRLDIRHPFLAS